MAQHGHILMCAEPCGAVTRLPCPSNADFGWTRNYFLKSIWKIIPHVWKVMWHQIKFFFNFRYIYCMTYSPPLTAITLNTTQVMCTRMICTHISCVVRWQFVKPSYHSIYFILSSSIPKRLVTTRWSFETHNTVNPSSVSPKGNVKVRSALPWLPCLCINTLLSGRKSSPPSSVNYSHLLPLKIASPTISLKVKK